MSDSAQAIVEQQANWKRFELVEERVLLTGPTELPFVSFELEEVELFDDAEDLRIIAGESADLNNDGREDYVVATANWGGSKRHVRFLLTDADGVPREIASHPIIGHVFFSHQDLHEPHSYYQFDLLVVDLNNDGLDDVVGASKSRVQTFVQEPSANGWRTTEHDFAAGSLTDILATDVDGDTFQDLVWSGRSVNVLIGKGDGSFADATKYFEHFGVVDALDLDADGDVDLLGGASVLLNDGTGVFEEGKTFPVGSHGRGTPWKIAHFDADPHLDLLTTSRPWGFQIHRGVGDGSFDETPITYETVGEHPIKVEVLDLNQDGFSDVVALFEYADRLIVDGTVIDEHRFVPGGVSVFLGTPEGLSREVRITNDNSLDVLVVDPLDDAAPEIVSFGKNTATRIRPVEQSLIVSAADYSRPAYRSSGSKLSLGDYNGDGLLDVVSVDTGHVYLANEDGSYVEIPLVIPDGIRVGGAFAADFDGDGFDDLAFAVSDLFLLFGVRSIAVSMSEGRGEFAPAQRVNLGSVDRSSSIWLRAILDFNNDGREDIVGTDSGEVVVISQGESGEWRRQTSQLSSDGWIESFRVGDFNNDGNSDFFVEFLNHEPQLLYGNGQGEFQESDTADQLRFIARGDLNGDGYLDSISYSSGTDSHNVHWGSESGISDSGRPLTGADLGTDILMFDVDLDGDDEILITDSAGFHVYDWIGHANPALDEEVIERQQYVHLGFEPGEMRYVDTVDESKAPLVVGPLDLNSQHYSARLAILSRESDRFSAPVFVAIPAIEAGTAEISLDERLKITLRHHEGFSVLHGPRIEPKFDADTICRITDQREHTRREQLLYDQNGDGNVYDEDFDLFLSAAHQTLRGDLDLDGDVDFIDFLKLAANFGSVDAVYAQGDVNCDGEVGFLDFLDLGNRFGRVPQ